MRARAVTLAIASSALVISLLTGAKNGCQPVPVEPLDDPHCLQYEVPMGSDIVFHAINVASYEEGKKLLADAAGAQNESIDPGTCGSLGTGCTKEYNPVCGDGQTYGNPCMFEVTVTQQAGDDGSAKGAFTAGACGTSTGCTSDADCAKGQICEMDCSAGCKPSGFVACCTGTCVAETTGCVVDGVVYEAGDTYPAGDGCNTCTCMDNGMSACTKKYCPAPCEYGGKLYNVGESFPSTDGCNQCTCLAGGVACTEKACMCNPNTEWYRDYIGESPEKCAVIKFACPDATNYFSNACGCGCEQDPSCPEWFNCMPGPGAPPCDPDAIKAKCPYSGIAY